MKIKIVLSVFVLGAIAALSMFYLNGSAGAATTGTVSPTVTVNTTLSLTMEEGTEAGTNVQWGSQAAGTRQTGTIQALVSANTPWNLTVQATAGHTGTNELTNGNQHIDSSHFKYTSAAGTPAPNGAGAPSTQFDGGNESSVWSGVTATDACRVAITYTLDIPALQPPGTYTATHRYTLTSKP